MNYSIIAHEQKLNLLFTKVSGIVNLADQAEWAKYLCVLTAGYIEESLRVMIIDFVNNNASNEIKNYMRGEISMITNCKTTKIETILRKYDEKWVEKFQNEIDARSVMMNEIKDSINSIVENRHKIAHGKSIGIGFVTVSNYFRNVKKGIIALDRVIR